MIFFYDLIMCRLIWDKYTNTMFGKEEKLEEKENGWKELKRKEDKRKDHKFPHLDKEGKKEELGSKVGNIINYYDKIP